MRIGYACIPLGVLYSTNRRFNLKYFTKERFLETVDANLSDLMKILEYNVENRIHLFRISSDIIPFGSHEINHVPWDSIFKTQLLAIGNYIRDKNIRVSMHPGQYTVLNSPNTDIVERAIKDIEYHCLFLDSLGVNYHSKIVLHVGGVYDSKADALKRFEVNFNKLSESARKRLVIENDERSYTIEDVLYLAEQIGTPVIFDNLHHELNPSLSTSLENILEKVYKTWSPIDGPMKLHYSEKNYYKKSGAHSDFVNSQNFMKFYKTVSKFSSDIMLEVKDKDLSVIKCIHYTHPKDADINKVWINHIFTVMERSTSLYDNCNEAFVNDNIQDLYSSIDAALALPISEANQTSTLENISYYLKDQIVIKDQEKLFTLLKNHENLKAKRLIYRLAVKHQIDFLLNTYFFIY